MADSVRDSVVVAADVAAVLAVITDVEAYPEWQPEVREAQALHRDEDGRVTRARFVFEAMGVQAVVVLDYTHTASSVRWTLVQGDTVRRDDGAYQLADRGDGTTQVTYDLQVEPAIPVPAVLRRSVARRIVDRALRGLQRRVESRP